MTVLSAPFLVEPNAMEPSVSRQGTLALQRGGGSLDGNLAWVTRTGEVDPIEGDFDSISAPILSPDGTRITFAAGKQNEKDVWVHHLERHDNTRMTFIEGLVSPLAWSHDNLEIAVIQYEPAAESITKTHFISADGSGESRPTMDGAVMAIDHEWKLAGCLDDPATELLELRAISLADPQTTINQLALSQFNLFDISLSPDGTVLAYTSRESGTNQIYCTRFPEGSGKWQISTQGGSTPKWSPDGSRLYFRSRGDTQDAIYEVEVTREPALRFAIPEQIFDGAAFDLSLSRGWYPTADGQRFVVVANAPPEPTESPVTLSIIQNWFEEHRNR